MKSHTKMLLFTILNMCQSNSATQKNNNVNPIYFINKTNGYIGEGNGRNYLTLVLTDESRSMKKKTTKRTIQKNLRSY